LGEVGADMLHRIEGFKARLGGVDWVKGQEEASFLEKRSKKLLFNWNRASTGKPAKHAVSYRENRG